MKPAEFLAHVIRPTLAHLDLGGPAAETLLLGTAMAESDLEYLRQIRGPALSFYQIEPATHDDNYENYLRFKPSLQSVVQSFLAESMFSPEQQLTWNMAYATAHARIKYWRDKKPLPAWDDAMGLAHYYKRVFNSHVGKARVPKAAKQFREAIEIVKSA